MQKAYDFKLSDLLKYDNIVIQCHDNPDPDAVSSAFGVLTYLQRQGKTVKIIYSGFERIKKRNVQLMLDWLNIPVEYIKNTEDFGRPGLLICVDCQYGEGNVTRIEADAVAVIDHHRPSSSQVYDLGAIQSQLGSCATLVWDLLRREDFDFAADKDIPAALYYGLLTDTNGFSEINHPLDKDMRDGLEKYCDRGIVRRLSLCNLTIDELSIAGVALLRNYNDLDKRYALFKSEFCDPNILGFISDIALQVDTVDVCVVYSQRDNGAKISVRSCTREVMASEFARFLTAGVGNGGGHRDKAGGWLQKAELDELGMSTDEYMKVKTREYFDSYDLVDSAHHNIDTASMKKYVKKPIPRGFAVSSDVFPEGTPIMIRTLEGDSNLKASPDIYLMVGVQGEVYPTRAAKFHAQYKIYDGHYNAEYEYEPIVKNELTGETKSIDPYLKTCISFGESPIFAAPLTRNTKVFTEWNPGGYMSGKEGDYIAIKCSDINDVYIIQESIFNLTYREM